MIGMALFQGLLDREGRVLDKANRLVNSGNAALDADAPGRAAIAFVKALEILEAQEPAAGGGPERRADARTNSTRPKPRSTAPFGSTPRAKGPWKGNHSRTSPPGIPREPSVASTG